MQLNNKFIRYVYVVWSYLSMDSTYDNVPGAKGEQKARVIYGAKLYMMDAHI
jgi:hypothetical protein